MQGLTVLTRYCVYYMYLIRYGNVVKNVAMVLNLYRKVLLIMVKLRFYDITLSTEKSSIMIMILSISINLEYL